MRRKSGLNNITWQKPECWTHKGYKCYVYQSSNEYLNWRLLEMVRPDGTQANDPNIPSRKTHHTPYNISASRKQAQEWLKQKIAWDQKSDDEKKTIIEAEKNRPLW